MMKPRGYRGECGQCDFVANSALKMEQHLLTHGIVFNISVADGEVSKPHSKKKKTKAKKKMWGKRKVKTELPDEDNGDPSKMSMELSACSSGQLDNVASEPEIKDHPNSANHITNMDDTSEGKTGDSCELLFAEGMQCEPSIDIKSEEQNEELSLMKEVNNETGNEWQTPPVPAASTDNLPMPVVSINNVISCADNLAEYQPNHKQLLDRVVDVYENEGQPIENEDLHLALSNADSSSDNSLLSNSMNTSDTLSASELDASHKSFNIRVKQEPVDDDVSESWTSLPTTPETHKNRSSNVVTRTPPDHDYIQRSPSPEVVGDTVIPEALKEEFAMNCVSIKQEEFDNMCTPNPTDVSDSGVIVIAPHGDESEMNELCSLVTGNEAGTSSSSTAVAQDENSSMQSVSNEDGNTGMNGLIKTDVLRSILLGQVSPSGYTSPGSEKDVIKDHLGRKMYSLPCTFTNEGKLRLMPASSKAFTHYIVVSPAIPGKQPYLFLVEKSKVQTVGPQKTLMQGYTRTVKQQNRKQIFPPKTQLEKARHDLSAVLAKAHDSKPKPTKPDSKPKVTKPEPEKVIYESNPYPPPAKNDNQGDKTFYCRKQGCVFSTEKYFVYQSHVMHCWMDHGFMVCEEDPCYGTYRTKSKADFRIHCSQVHDDVSLHSCSICVYLGTQRDQIIEHYAMYHQDMYAPESPFLSVQAKAYQINSAHQKLSPQKKSVSPKAKKPCLQTSEHKLSVSLSSGLGSITNASVNVVSEMPNVNASTCTGNATSGYYNVTLGPKSPLKVHCPEPTSKKVKELLQTLSPSLTGENPSYSAKKLEESLEPAARLLTQSVKAKYWLDLSEKHSKCSPSKINVYNTGLLHIKKEPVDNDFDKPKCAAYQDIKDLQMNQSENAVTLKKKEARQTLSSSQGALVKDNVSTVVQNPMPNLLDSIKVATGKCVEETSCVSEVRSLQRSHSPHENNFEEEYLDGTVDEDFVFDEFDQNATAEEIYDEQPMVTEKEELVKDDLDKIHPCSMEGDKIKQLVLQEKDGTKSHVLLEAPVPRQSGRVRKPKSNKCNLSCCVNNKRKRRKKRNISLISDIKIASKPVVVLIDIMSLVKPMLGLESPIKHSRKQTARKSTAKRGRVVKKNRCSCCKD